MCNREQTGQIHIHTSARTHRTLCLCGDGDRGRDAKPDLEYIGQLKSAPALALDNCQAEKWIYGATIAATFIAYLRIPMLLPKLTELSSGNSKTLQSTLSSSTSYSPNGPSPAIACPTQSQRPIASKCPSHPSLAITTNMSCRFVHASFMKMLECGIALPS